MTERYQENSRRTRRVENASTVIAHLVAQQAETTEPEVDLTYHPFQIVVEDALLGFDSEGNYHCPRLRTEHLDGTL
jgi:hypothetical protein